MKFFHFKTASALISLTTFCAIALCQSNSNNPIPEKYLKILEAGENVVIADINSLGLPNSGQQTLDYFAGGPHPKDCRTALRTLKYYEHYDQYLSFLKKSQYDDAKQELQLKFSLESLDLYFVLLFNIARPEKPGSYPFEFVSGLYPGLKGTLHVLEHEDKSKFFRKKRCLFFVEAHWQGTQPPYSENIMELFLMTVSHAGIERLFRVSNH